MKRPDNSTSPEGLGAALLLFTAFALAVHLLGWLTSRTATALGGMDARAVGFAISVDLILTIPIVFYLLIVRGHGMPAVSILPIVAACMWSASHVVPVQHPEVLHAAKALLVPLEVLALAWIAWRARTALRTVHELGDGDPVARYGGAARDLIRHRRIAAILATEMAVLHYAVGAWRARADVPPGTTAFTHHRRSGLAATVGVLTFVLVAEAIAVHMLVARWSAVAAWLLTIGTAYVALWLLADYRATILRPVLLADNALLVRMGVRWTIRVPLQAIVSVGRNAPANGTRRLALPLLTAPSHWIALSEPAPAVGPYGAHRDVTAIGLSPDSPTELSALLALPRSDGAALASGAAAGADREGLDARTPTSAMTAGPRAEAGPLASPDHQHPPRPEVARAVIIGGAVFLGLMLLLAGAATTMGWLTPEPEAGQVDLTAWLLLEIGGGIPAAVLAGWISRRRAGASRAPRILAVLVLAAGVIEAAEILDGSGRGALIAPWWLVVPAPLLAAGGVLLGGGALNRARGPHPPLGPSAR